MFLFYSFLFTLAFIIMLPVFIAHREKYAAGFRERLGSYPEFKHDGRKVIWLHCVSVGETNAARPLVDQILSEFPNHRLVISTTTKTGQALARDIFKDKADAVFYFPFDFKFSVRRALDNFKPSVALLMETEIWARFIQEAKIKGSKIAIVNGRLSEKSFRRYSRFKNFIRNVLAEVDLALMQGEPDAGRIDLLGMEAAKTFITGNLKFDLKINESEVAVTEVFRTRFAIRSERPLIVAASTHSTEEELILHAFRRLYDSSENKPRLLIAPRHPQRFDEVGEIIKGGGFTYARSSAVESETDRSADVILLDSIGELRAVFPLAEIVFVGGSLIPHGGQNILEPASAGKAIVTGPYTHNFATIVDTFKERKGLIQLSADSGANRFIEPLTKVLAGLLLDPVEREFLGRNARSVMDQNSGATAKTIELLAPLIVEKGG